MTVSRLYDPKYQTRLKILAGNKHSSFFGLGINEERKGCYKILSVSPSISSFVLSESHFARAILLSDFALQISLNRVFTN